LRHHLWLLGNAAIDPSRLTGPLANYQVGRRNRHSEETIGRGATYFVGTLSGINSRKDSAQKQFKNGGLAEVRKYGNSRTYSPVNGRKRRTVSRNKITE